jgi:hypothetical protein
VPDLTEASLACYSLAPQISEPFVFSERLTDLASQGQFDEAVVMLQNPPLDASNVTT